MLDKKVTTIKCPQCGREYLPAEIFYPKHFFGVPRNIEKNNKTGEIEYFSGESMDLSEDYICDSCGCNFEVYAKISFKVSEIEKYNMDKEYTSSLEDDRFTLNEFEGE